MLRLCADEDMHISDTNQLGTPLKYRVGSFSVDLTFFFSLKTTVFVDRCSFVSDDTEIAELPLTWSITEKDTVFKTEYTALLPICRRAPFFSGGSAARPTRSHLTRQL